MSCWCKPCIYLRVCACMCLCACVCVCLCVCVCVCTRVHVYVFMCVHVHVHRFVCSYVLTFRAEEYAPTANFDNAMLVTRSVVALVSTRKCPDVFAPPPPSLTHTHAHTRVTRYAWQLYSNDLF
jgi:hypothetical protein